MEDKLPKALMIQGTSSNAGKSLIVTALCRIMRRNGINVAPFKAQNMSLQSFITKDGGEIGLAQAIQAFAAKVEPDIYMNPVLLKASGEQGSQVIVHGKVYKTMKPKEYYSEREKLWKAVTYSLDYLKTKHELLIIEGAGSPAEINLIEHDIVNMAVAEYLNAPVIIVGDIDRGGVFASIYGTVKLLKFHETLIKGFIINKFRGDFDILVPGIKEIENLINKPCIGIIPYLKNAGISAEDGFSLTSSINNQISLLTGTIKIVVLRLRYISNFSDFDPLKIEPDVELIYSLRKEDLLNADIIIIPGSKKTIEDLKLIKELGVDELLRKLSKNRTGIIGICGGFQMLGKKLIDPHGVESSLKEIDGIGLLPVETIFHPYKITTQVEGYVNSKPSITIKGYEIHMGETSGEINLFHIKRLATGESIFDGATRENIWGTYIHGIFENDSFRRLIINKHRVKKGLKPVEFISSWQKIKEDFIEKLADNIASSLSMERIWRLIGI